MKMGNSTSEGCVCLLGVIGTAPGGAANETAAACEAASSELQSGQANRL
jgi:hypothetical protein